jgi:murein DD-endopeptidase MepM/ murein hydrolase activator NlpD
LKEYIRNIKAALRRFKEEERYRVLRQALVGIVAISLLSIATSYLFYSPKMHIIAVENRELVLKYEILQDRIASMQSKLQEIRHRDQNVYRMLFSSDTLSLPGIFTPYPDSKYAELADDYYSDLMTATWLEIDAATRLAYATSLSLDQLQTLAKDKEQLSLAIPAIWPIDRTKLKAFYSFGFRNSHPIYGTRAMHKGVDLSANYGTPVFATGDGIVEKVDNGQADFGYGKQILIDHKFAYKSRYAHLQRIFVEQGQKVKRGQLIGEVGSTGGSTGPHLHYEVIYLNQPVNPINYFNLDLTPEAYQELVKNIRYNTDLEVSHRVTDIPK